MNQDKQPHLPIGYWLKKADEALTSRINNVQETNGLSRTEWQILNTLHEVTTATGEQLALPLQPFTDASSLEEITRNLIKRGLVEGEGSTTSGYRLTDQGQRLHQTALALQKEVRQQAVRGVSEADYATTVQVLQQLVKNLISTDNDKK